jgi:hypothetical protein
MLLVCEQDEISVSSLSDARITDLLSTANTASSLQVW